MAEEQSVFDYILTNLVSTFDGMVLPYNGEDHVVTSDYSRLIDNCTSYPFVVVQENFGEFGKLSSQSMPANLTYSITCYIGEVNDEAKNGCRASGDIFKNVNAYLMTKTMEDPTRGGRALDTKLTGFSNFVEDFGTYYEYIFLHEIIVSVFVDYQNMFRRTG